MFFQGFNIFLMTFRELICIFKIYNDSLRINHVHARATTRARADVPSSFASKGWKENPNQKFSASPIERGVDLMGFDLDSCSPVYPNGPIHVRTHAYARRQGAAFFFFFRYHTPLI